MNQECGRDGRTTRLDSEIVVQASRLHTPRLRVRVRIYVWRWDLVELSDAFDSRPYLLDAFDQTVQGRALPGELLRFRANEAGIGSDR